MGTENNNSNNNEADSLFATRRKKQQEEENEKKRHEELERQKADMEAEIKRLEALQAQQTGENAAKSRKGISKNAVKYGLIGAGALVVLIVLLNIIEDVIYDNMVIEPAEPDVTTTVTTTVAETTEKVTEAEKKEAADTVFSDEDMSLDREEFMEIFREILEEDEDCARLAREVKNNDWYNMKDPVDGFDYSYPSVFTYDTDTDCYSYYCADTDQEVNFSFGKVASEEQVGLLEGERLEVFLSALFKDATDCTDCEVTGYNLGSGSFSVVYPGEKSEEEYGEGSLYPSFALMYRDGDYYLLAAETTYREAADAISVDEYIMFFTDMVASVHYE